MTAATIHILEKSIQIEAMEVPVKEVVDFFRTVSPEERPFLLQKAIEVGVFCLERGRTAQDTEFVKRKVTELLAHVEQAVTAIPAKAEEALIRQMGTNDGQVLNPVRVLVDNASSETAKRIVELKSLLKDDLDPKNSQSTLGTALQSLRDLLNPTNTQSIQSALDRAVHLATAENGVLGRASRAKSSWRSKSRTSCRSVDASGTEELTKGLSPVSI